MPVDLASRRCFRFRLNPLCAELFCFHSKNTSSSSSTKKKPPKKTNAAVAFYPTVEKSSPKVPFDLALLRVCLEMMSVLPKPARARGMHRGPQNPGSRPSPLLRGSEGEQVVGILAHTLNSTRQATARSSLLTSRCEVSREDARSAEVTATGSPRYKPSRPLGCGGPESEERRL